METIRFSHTYNKLPCEDGCYLILLEVFKTHYNDLSKTFLEYDTTYKEGHYDLPRTDLLVLLFKSEKGNLVFTTLRRYTEEKEQYYKKHRGDIFKLLIREEDIRE